MQSRIRVLLVMPRQFRSALIDTLQDCAVELLAACNCKEARRIVESGPPIDVVMVAADLPDGAWHDVLDAARSNCAPQVIVCASGADPALWRDLRDKGACDVLVEPYSAEEVRRAVRQASNLGYMRALRVAPQVEPGVEIPRFA